VLQGQHLFSGGTETRYNIQIVSIHGASPQTLNFLIWDKGQCQKSGSSLSKKFMNKKFMWDKKLRFMWYFQCWQMDDNPNVTMRQQSLHENTKQTSKSIPLKMHSFFLSFLTYWRKRIQSEHKLHKIDQKCVLQISKGIML
jgi:hypothetical protein